MPAKQLQIPYVIRSAPFPRYNVVDLKMVRLEMRTATGAVPMLLSV